MRLWLKQARELKKMDHADVAKCARISRSFYTHIENGTKDPSVKVAKAIGAVLDVTWTNFFNDKCSLEEQKSATA